MFGELIDYGDRAITRPPRSTYDIDSIPIELEVPDFGKVKRIPIHFPNNRGCKIIGSYYMPESSDVQCDACVIYLHGNASCQLEGTYLIPFLVPIGISVLCFDFSGCGLSQGHRISLGYLEKDDVKAAMTYVEVHYNIHKFGIWGRSMGAACTFFCLNNEEKIKGAVVDSPFASLPELVKDLALQMGVPGCLGIPTIALKMLTTKVLESSGFNINDVLPIEEAKKAITPIYIIHGKRDDFIYVKHSINLFNSYRGTNKTLRIIDDQDHHGDRPNNITCEALIFISQCLGKELHVEEVTSQINHGGLHFGNLEDLLHHLNDYD